MSTPATPLASSLTSAEVTAALGRWRALAVAALLLHAPLDSGLCRVCGAAWPCRTVCAACRALDA